MSSKSKGGHVVDLDGQYGGKEGASLEPSPYERAGFLSKLSFWWMNPIMRKGYAGTLSEADLSLNKSDQAHLNADAFQANWEAELASANPKMLRALKKTFGWELARSGVFMFLWGAFVILSAFFFVRQLFVFVRDGSDKNLDNDPPYWKGWVLASCFLVSIFCLCLCLQQMSIRVIQLGVKVRGALMTMVYRKSLRVANVGSDVGDVVSLISNDCSRLMEGIIFFHYLWAGPFVGGAIVVCIFVLVGLAAFPSIGVVLILFGIQFSAGAIIVRNRGLTIADTDQRVNVVNEVLQSIKVVKSYAWEKQFADLVADIRKRELRLLRKTSIIKSINILSVFGTPPTIAVVVFATWIFGLGSKFMGEIVFTMLTLFNTLRLPMSFLPKAIKGLSESLCAISRITDFLLRPEVEPIEDRGVVGVTMTNASFSYGGPEPVIRDINMDIKQGQLMALVGPVGCGKSTLLCGLLTEGKLLSGEATIGGSIAYVPQTPWIQHGTVRDNIVFGHAFDDEKYRRVVFACALERDMEILDNGDMTEIGERGINLSGGQRQRIALARAVYSESDIQLLDNPLSAVDQHTCKHIFDYCIKDMLCATGKTVILVTHQLELLNQCDLVAVMEDGAIPFFGGYDYNVLAKYFPQWAASNPAPAADAAVAVVEKRTGKPKDHVPGRKVQNEGKKMVEEDTASGRLGFFASFLLWCKAAGYRRSCLSLIFFIAAQICRTSGDYWLTIWVAADSGNPANRIPLDKNYVLNYNNIPKYVFMIIYAVFLFLFWALMYVRGVYFYKIALDAATKLHDNMFRKVLRAPMGFFNKTPLGRLLNVVSKDMDTIDETLPDTFMITMIYMFILLVTLCFVTGVLYYFAIVAFILVVGFFGLNHYYIKTTRVLKSISGASASPIFAHLAETLSGIAVVRAFRKQDMFKSENLKRVDRNHRSIFTLEAAQLWAGHRLDWLGCLLVFSVAAFAVAFKPSQTGFSAGAFGFAVSNAFQMLLFFTAFVRGSADIESMLGAVERVTYYTANIPEEAPLVVEGKRPPANWPSKGTIDFNDVVMKYSPDLPPALRNVNFTIEDGEKVGIVGRTGSGKSTTLLALFRLYESEVGKITVDGQDVSQFGLHDVRSRFGILPQEPVMFKGTVRSNLDPFSEKSDNELWTALDKAHLRPVVEVMPGQLDAPVSEGGSNFSLGQKQLFCLARAILKKSKLLFLDEATAAMDLETDSLIQQVIAREFAGSTVCTIAHRLDTIITSDRILVMDAGQALEFDTPYNLLNNPESSFYKLVQQVGADAANALQQMANAHEEEKRRGAH